METAQHKRWEVLLEHLETQLVSLLDSIIGSGVYSNDVWRTLFLRG
jgi:hypothetical protein